MERSHPFDVRLNYVDATRKVFQLLLLEAEARSIRSNPDEALRCVRAILNSANSLRDEMFCLSQMARIAGRRIAASQTNRILALGEPKNGLAELQAQFETEMKEELLVAIIRGERAYGNVVFEKVEAGQLTVNDFSVLTCTPNMRATPWEQFCIWRYDPRGYHNHALYLRWCNQFLAIKNLPWESRQKAFDDVATITPPSFETFLARRLSQDFSKIYFPLLRDQASLRCAVVGIACERYRQRNGHWPATLEIIPRDLLPELPTDPYAGKPLRYKHLDDGVVVYSVGPDLVDDDGKLKVERTGERQSYDIGFRLWNPDRRGLPPIEKRELLPLPKASP